MIEDTIYKGTLQVASYDLTVKVIPDYHVELLDNTDMASEVKEINLPDKVHHTLTQHGAIWAIDYNDHSVYVKAGEKFFVLRETLKETQKSIIDYARETGQFMTKHDAWCKALEYAKHDAQYIAQYYNDDWCFIGLQLEAIERKTDKSGLIWSRELDNEFGSLWGIEWSTTSNKLIDNEQQFKSIVPDLLPQGLVLNDYQLNEFWLNLE